MQDQVNQGHDNRQNQNLGKGRKYRAQIAIHAQSQEHAKDIEGQNRHNKAPDYLNYDVLQFLGDSVQGIGLHGSHSYTDAERQQEGSHNLKRRRHLHLEVGRECTLINIGDISNQILTTKHGGVEPVGKHVGKKTGDNSGAIGNPRCNPQPLTGTTPETRNGRSDQRENKDRDKEVEEVAK